MRTRFEIVVAVVLVMLAVTTARAAEKSIALFVALADNKNQGIVPVPAALGNGEDPEKNLYWGSGEGFKTVFDRSKEWKLTSKTDEPAGNVLRQRTYRHAATNATIVAKAYKGAAIKHCIGDFEAAIAAARHDVIVYVGHNGLMDFQLAAPKKPEAPQRHPEVVVLCCKSDEYFKARVEAAGGKPLVLTTQLMYPGSFLVHAATGEWLAGADREKIRSACAAAYAKNQGISQNAAARIFAEIR